MFAIVDLETTGGHSVRDRITEVAIIVHDGHKVIQKFASLVNPEQHIPGYITDITGIDNEMVSDAPPFRQIAAEVDALTKDCVFVAHNVGFDYGFLRESFLRLGIEWRRTKLCTVRTSRKLIPGLRSYSLGKLCAHLGIPIKDRHRAMGDADATAILLEQLFEANPDLLEMGKPKDPYADLPQHLDRKQLDELPETPGIFFFLDQAHTPIYAAKSKNIRRDALKQLRKGTGKNAVSAEQVFGMAWEPTGNELLATLRLPGELQSRPTVPAPKMRLKKYRAGVFAYRDQRNYTRLYVGPLKKGIHPLAEFPTAEDAEAALLARMKQHRLCISLTGIETDNCPPAACEGACRDEEDAEQYNERLYEALQGLGFPFPRFFLLGDGRHHEEVSIVCVEHGECVGYAYLDATQSWANPDAVRGLLNPFEQVVESAKIVRQYLPRAKSAQIIPY